MDIYGLIGNTELCADSLRGFAVEQKHQDFPFALGDMRWRGGNLVASFPVEIDDQVMLATSKGQSIRVPVEGISFRSRSAGGVKVFDTGKGEVVVSVARIADQSDDEDVESL